MENGQFSTEFILWYRKTEHLTPEEWLRGMEKIEYEVIEARRLGEKCSPPSYAAFIGLCRVPHGEMAHKLYQPIGLPDKGAQERSEVVGSKEINRMKEMFNL